jgi:hypothetical protein
MRQRAEIEDRRVVARRLFDALCTQHPDKYIYLIQLGDLADDPPDHPHYPKDCGVKLRFFDAKFAILSDA